MIPSSAFWVNNAQSHWPLGDNETRGARHTLRSISSQWLQMKRKYSHFSWREPPTSPWLLEHGEKYRPRPWFIGPKTLCQLWSSDLKLIASRYDDTACNVSLRKRPPRYSMRAARLSFLALRSARPSSKQQSLKMERRGICVKCFRDRKTKSVSWCRHALDYPSKTKKSCGIKNKENVWVTLRLFASHRCPFVSLLTRNLFTVFPAKDTGSA